MSSSAIAVAMAISCAICEGSIGRYDDYICCRSHCNGNFHIKCAGISVVDFTSLKQNNKLKEWICETCLNSEQVAITSEDISEKHPLTNSLQNINHQVSDHNQIAKGTGTINKNTKAVPVRTLTTNEKIPDKGSSDKNVDMEFTEVTRKRRRNQQRTIQGTASPSMLKGATFFSHVHVFGLDTKTTTADVIDYLKTQNVDQVTCEQMQSKYPEQYSSFKISVPSAKLKEVQNPEIWPTGVKINRFLFRIPKNSKPK
ncbi:hypothetical protein QE152_g4611 [Popillia japonica]|uniref:PHD-type domain-containing protein n=1 Tax=Popillia japonica TaxID=7064 RepID=A0AAW1N047_POPJA